MLTMEVLVVFLPLLGFLLAGILGKRLGHHGAEYLTTALMLVAAFFSVKLFGHYAVEGHKQTITLLNWIEVGNLKVDWALRFDALTAVMLVVVNVVSAMVHLYSIGYMHHDPHRPRFFAYLSLFTFAMLMLVTADNLIQMFFGWEGVGLASYLLINFWYKKPSANAASIKAFLVNRVGDFGYALGIMGIYFTFGTVSFDGIFALLGADTNFEFFGYTLDAVTISCLLLFMGAMGKSAQLGLHTWLPDAMEGPTPVSALIHAATMVTAGVFMLCRLSPLFETVPEVLAFVTLIGALTAFVAATIGMTQFDIKRVIAYSTMSQLGYMFFAIGVGAYGAAMFHLMTHAFFKALLFLGAGSVIHAMSDEQDLRKMGGLWKKIPVTWALMWIGSLALAGVPYFAGYYSKDIILESAWASHSAFGQFAWYMGIAAALMTAFYSWRLLIMAFHGKTRASEETFSHAHESPFVMLLPLIVLAAGAIGAGAYAYDWFVGEGRADFWRGVLAVGEHDVIHAAHEVEGLVKHMPTYVGVAGILLAFLAYLWVPKLPALVVRALPAVHMLFYRKWLFDELYDAVFVRRALRWGRAFWQVGDVKIIDGLGPNKFADAAFNASKELRAGQTGYVYHYAFVMVLALAALLVWLRW
jgi:NADH-quinone oxidoreductase subunit L